MHKKYFFFIILFLSTILWIYNANKYKMITNDLCKNNQSTRGWINRIERDNLNAGNISTWNVYYLYLVDGDRFEGEISFNDKVSFMKGDSVNVIYSQMNPQNSRLISNDDKMECVSFLQAMLEKWYYAIISVILISIMYLFNRTPPIPHE